MTLKQRVLDALRAANGTFVSGGELAVRHLVSRNAVWKAVQALGTDGYEIESVTGRGYRLVAEDVLTAAGVEKHVSATGLSIQVHDTLPSTNRLAKELAEAGAREGTVVIAATQTEGRGRLGRTFCSPDGTGVYMSVVLRPSVPADKALSLTVAAAVAVCRAIEKVSACTPQIKWVNDVYCRDRKVCGILTEASMDAETGRLSYAVLGIGINVRSPKEGFPAEIAQVAGALFHGTDGADRCTVAAAVLDAFFDEYAHLAEERYVQEYRQRSMLSGRAITVTTPLSQRAATALEVDEQCRLRVRYEDGTEASLSSGDVSIRI